MMKDNFMIEEATILGVSAYVCWALSYRMDNPVMGYVSLAMILIAFVTTVMAAVRLGKADMEQTPRNKALVHIVSGFIFQACFVACYFLFQ